MCSQAIPGQNVCCTGCDKFARNNLCERRSLFIICFYHLILLELKPFSPAEIQCAIVYMYIYITSEVSMRASKLRVAIISSKILFESRWYISVCVFGWSLNPRFNSGGSLNAPFNLFASSTKAFFTISKHVRPHSKNVHLQHNKHNHLLFGRWFRNSSHQKI